MPSLRRAQGLSHQPGAISPRCFRCRVPFPGQAMPSSPPIVATTSPQAGAAEGSLVPGEAAPAPAVCNEHRDKSCTVCLSVRLSGQHRLSGSTIWWHGHRTSPPRIPSLLPVRTSGHRDSKRGYTARFQISLADLEKTERIQGSPGNARFPRETQAKRKLKKRSRCPASSSCLAHRRAQSVTRPRRLSAGKQLPVLHPAH